MCEGQTETNRKPFDRVGISRAAGAATVLLVAEGIDHYGVFEGACIHSHQSA